MLSLHRRDLYRQKGILAVPHVADKNSVMDFDSTLGFPGEGPFRWLGLWTFPFLLSLLASSPVGCSLLDPWILRAGAAFLLLGSHGVLPASGCWVLFSCFTHGAMAMPIQAATPGEKRKS